MIHALHFSTPLLNATPSYPRFKRDPTIVMETATTLPQRHRVSPDLAPQPSTPLVSSLGITQCTRLRSSISTGAVHSQEFLLPNNRRKYDSSSFIYQSNNSNEIPSSPSTNIVARNQQPIPKEGIRILEKREREKSKRKKTVRSRRVARRGPKGREKEKGRVWWRTTRPQRSFQERTLWTSCIWLKMDESNLVCRSYRCEYVFQAG